MSYYQESPYAQPVYVPSYDGSHHGHRRRHGHHHSYQPTIEEAYPQPVTYVPTHSSGSRRHGRHHSTPIVVAPSAPVVPQPSYSSHGHHGRHHSHHNHSGNGHYHRTFGDRLRHFFGLAPSANYRYKSDKSSWGFMGYSRRPRYTDARTGAEVDRKGRPIYRV